MAEHILAQQYREGLQSFGQVMPDVIDAYNEFTNRCFQAGELTTKQKHLIALGIALFSGNEHCIMYHLNGALLEGVSEEEIAETVAVAGAFGGGSTFSHGVILINEVNQQQKNAVQ